MFHFGGFPNFMPRTPFSVIPHAMPFQTSIFAAELLWSPIMQKFPKIKMALAEGGIGWVPYFLEKADFVYDHHKAWTGADFGDKLPSQVFREHVQTCFIDDSTGLRNRHQIGVDTITWEADYPHSDSTWPESPEVLMKSLEEVGLPDDDIHKVTWENACRWYQFDPFEHRTREECTVGALRAQATDVDTTPREYGGFTTDAAVKELDKGNATNFLATNNATADTSAKRRRCSGAVPGGRDGVAESTVAGATEPDGARPPARGARRHPRPSARRPWPAGVNNCRSYSIVNPIAPCTWCARAKMPGITSRA